MRCFARKFQKAGRGDQADRGHRGGGARQQTDNYYFGGDGGFVGEQLCSDYL